MPSIIMHLSHILIYSSILFSSFLDYTFASTNPSVQTSKGQVIGYVKGVSARFQGIPYALPPVGQLRFAPPVSAKAWSQPLNATQFAPPCAQLTPRINTPLAGSSEDCLYANVFSPKGFTASSKLPVMVFIHGGDYIYGSADMYSPDGIDANFVANDVVVVTVQYRLGAFGLFTTRTNSVPANNAGLDLVLALKWVQTEIGNFGGDPDQVTMWGESAGSFFTSILSMSPLAKGLYSQAIMESGTAFSIPAVDGNDNFFHPCHKQYAVNSKCISAADWDSGRYGNLSTCLRSLSIDKLLSVDANYVLRDAYQKQTWMPVIDGPGGLLPDWPRNLVRNRPKNVPVLLGTNHDEMYYFYENVFRNKPNEVPIMFNGLIGIESAISQLVSNKTFGKYAKSVQEQLRINYKSSAHISETDYIGWFFQIMQMISGRIFFSSIAKEARELSRISNNVYLYSFDFQSQSFPFPAYKGKKVVGVPHAFELKYLFYAPGSQPEGWTPASDDLGLVKYFSTMWTNFGKTGFCSIRGSFLSVRANSIEFEADVGADCIRFVYIRRNPNLPIPLTSLTASKNSAWQPVPADPGHDTELSYFSIDYPQAQMGSGTFKAKEDQLWNYFVPLITNNPLGPTFPPPLNVSDAPIKPHPTCPVTVTNDGQLLNLEVRYDDAFGVIKTVRLSKGTKATVNAFNSVYVKGLLTRTIECPIPQASSYVCSAGGGAVITCTDADFFQIKCSFTNYPAGNCFE